MVLRFSFTSFAEKVILQRQVKRQADTFIIIYGTERSGKTTLGFNLLIPYIQLMRNISANGYRPSFIPPMYPSEKLWNPRPVDSEGNTKTNVKWSKIFKNNFAGDSFDASKKIKDNPYGAPLFIDEGTDVASWMEQMTREQKGLVHLLKKTGKKLMPTILITPSMSLLNKEMLRRAHYLFMILDEPRDDGNVAYLFKNWKNPILRETMPFGLKTIIEDVTKRKDLRMNEDSVRHYLLEKERMIGAIRFHPIDPKIYALYDKLVKDPLINKTNPGRRYIPFSQYQKLKYMFDTLLYNLYTYDEKSYSQILRLLTDKFGNILSSKNTIRSYVESVAVAQESRNITELDILGEDVEDNKETEPTDDLDLE